MKGSVAYKKLSSLCKVQNGYAFDSKLFTTDSNDMPLVRIRDIKTGRTETFYKGDYSQEYVLHNGDYIIGMDGEFNITEWQGGEALLNQRVCRVIVSSEIVLPKYILYFLPIPLKKIEDETPFVTVKHLSSKKLNDVVVPVPSLENQQRIVDELDLLTGIIDKKNAQLRDLDTLAQSIFYEMFGDPIANEKGWPIYHFGELCNSELGKMLDSKRAFGTKKPYLCTINVLWDKIDLSTQKEMLIEEDELDRYSVRKGDLLICEGGDIGRSAIWDREDEMYYQNSLHRIRFDETKMLPEVMLYIFKILKDRGELDQYGKGQTIKHLVKKTLLTIPVPVPDIQVQRYFAKKLASIKNDKSLVRQSLVSTQLLFESRMNKYFND